MIFNRCTTHLDCDCTGHRTDHTSCTSWFDAGKSCDDYTDDTMTKLVKDECLTSCNYCPTDPCNPVGKEGNICEKSIDERKIYFLYIHETIEIAGDKI